MVEETHGENAQASGRERKREDFTEVERCKAENGTSTR